jgi:hypothetical protein
LESSLIQKLFKKNRFQLDSSVALSSSRLGKKFSLRIWILIFIAGKEEQDIRIELETQQSTSQKKIKAITEKVLLYFLFRSD